MQLIGNQNIINQLNVAIMSAVKENRSLPHTLMAGAAGCGKTSMARKVSEALQSHFIQVAAESLKGNSEVVALIESLDKTGYDIHGNLIPGAKITPTIVFIDEIHGIPMAGQEHLGIAMEEWYVPVNDKKLVRTYAYDGYGMSKSGKVRWCPKFTLIGATTNDGLLSKPFRMRLKMKFLFGVYTLEESKQIVQVHAERLGIDIDADAAINVAKRGRGVPRVLVELLERCRDFAISIEYKLIDMGVTENTFFMLGIDSNGLGPTDIKILITLFNLDAPTGLDNLAVITNESRKVLSETIEPYLIQQGLIVRKSRGREITDAGKAYLAKNGHIPAEDTIKWVDVPAEAIKNRRM